MACGCKNKQNAVKTATPQKPVSPSSNGTNVRKLEKRVIR